MNINGLYYRGLLDNNNEIDSLFGKKTKVYICAGIMLMNLKYLRQDNIQREYENFILAHKSINYCDQTTLNYVCSGKLDGIPPKYGLYAYPDKNSVKQFYNYFPKDYKKDSYEDLVDAHYNPIIPHFAFFKPWKWPPKDKTLKSLQPNESQYHRWWQFAKLSDYYDEIYG